VKAQTRALRAAVGLGTRTAPAVLVGVLFVAAVGAALPVSLAWLTKAVIDRLAAGAGVAAVVPATVGLALVGLAGGALPHLDQLLRAELARAIGLAAQDRLYQAINGYTGLTRFEDPAHLDRIRMAQQCGQSTPSEIINSGVGLARTSVTVAGFLLSLYLVSAWMTAVVVLAGLPTLYTELRLARTLASAAVETSSLERREWFYADLLGNVRAAMEVRLFGIGDHLRSRMRAERLAINALRRRVDRKEFAAQGGLAFLSAAVGAGGLIWAVQAAARGSLTIGDVSMFIAGVAAVQSGLAQIAVAAAAAHHHLLLFGHYVAVTTDGTDLPLLARSSGDPVPGSGIELRDVWFRYSPQHDWVLRGVTLTIPWGRSVGLVGANGAGKSTLIKLLCRFYDPDRGAIRWDGVDIRTMPPAELRSRISAIFQDFMEYDVTAAENIAMGDLRRGRDEHNIAEAADQAGIHQYLAGLPHGYDTMLTRAFAAGDPGAHGVSLSGGQWQRVALARAFLRQDRDLLILDEPSAGLDANAESELSAALRRYRAGHTSLLVSHRLSAVRGADVIVVLDNGVVAERGSHAELVEADGIYGRMFKLQAEGYRPDADRDGLRAGAR
jgi:ATP-binding cassette, subfamily B, bacterial